MKKLKKFYADYHHAIPLIAYGIIYLTWFCHLEKTVTRQYTVIHMALDDYIPFVEIFVIPYFLWLSSSFSRINRNIIGRVFFFLPA